MIATHIFALLVVAGMAALIGIGVHWAAGIGVGLIGAIIVGASAAS